MLDLKRINRARDCVKQGLLRRIPVSISVAESSLRASERWLLEAETGLSSGALNSSVMSSYLAMFHSSRAVLYRDGCREKSHYDTGSRKPMTLVMGSSLHCQVS